MIKILTVQNIAKTRKITLPSARVFTSREAKKGTFLRIKRNSYIKKEDFKQYSRTDLYTMAALLQTPSYISLLTALSFYEFTTQILPATVESIAVQRAKQVQIENTRFIFIKIQKNLFTDFKRVENFFIATPEKALVDCLYLMSMGKYSIDIGSIDWNKFDKKVLKNLVKKYPQKTQKLFFKLTL